MRSTTRWKTTRQFQLDLNIFLSNENSLRVLSPICTSRVLHLTSPVANKSSRSVLTSSHCSLVRQVDECHSTRMMMMMTFHEIVLK